MGAGLNKKAKERLHSCRRDGGTYLNLTECDIEDAKQLGAIIGMKTLVKLCLSKNRLVKLPNDIKKLNQLQELDLDLNSLEELNPVIGEMKALNRLNLSYNALKDLPSMGGLRSLRILDISGNGIHSLPGDFSTLSSLTSLDYSTNHIDVVPDQVMNLNNQIRVLKLAKNNIKDKLPTKIATFSVIEELDLADNGITIFPPELCGLTTLKRLNLGGNQLQLVNEGISRLVKLEVLDLSRNQIKTLDGIDFQNFGELLELNLGSNQLKFFTRGLSGCKKLKIFDLSYNELERCPKQLGWLDESLRKINLQNNKLVVLPGELCFLSPSTDINLKENPLKFPFRENYQTGVPCLLDGLRPYCSAYPFTTTAEGQGLRAAIAGRPSEFTIRACDRQGGARPNGGDTFIGMIKRDKELVLGIIVADQKDGTYKGYYNCPQAGTFTLSIECDGESIKGSPYELVIHPGELDVDSCKAVGEGLVRGKPGSTLSFEIITSDKNGNPRTQGGDKIDVTIESDSQAAFKGDVQDTGTGTYSVTFPAKAPGEYEINVKIGGKNIPGTPFFCNVG